MIRLYDFPALITWDEGTQKFMKTTSHQVKHVDRKTKYAAPILVIADDEKDIRTEKEGIETVKGLSLQ